MSMNACWSTIPLTHRIRASALFRSNFQQIVRKNGFRTNPRSTLNHCTVGAQRSNFSSYSSTRSHRSSFGGGGTFYKYAGVAGLGLGVAMSAVPGKTVYCEPASPAQTRSRAADEPLPPPPQSLVNVYELSFGTVCGVCAGVFVKKGAKAVAFIFGGVFVLLQYFGSLSLVRVDWGRMATRFENLFHTTDAQGIRRAPTPGSLVRWLIDFLTADFQQRASFVAGFALGLRLG